MGSSAKGETLASDDSDEFATSINVGFTPYREGQEDQLGAMGLVVNAIVLWNTIYMDAALRQLRNEGYPVRDEDVARLSPTMRPHINMLGRHSFILPEAVARGELRPLRDPRQTMDEAA